MVFRARAVAIFGPKRAAWKNKVWEPFR